MNPHVPLIQAFTLSNELSYLYKMIVISGFIGGVVVKEILDRNMHPVTASIFTQVSNFLS